MPKRDAEKGVGTDPRSPPGPLGPDATPVAPQGLPLTAD
ncbi:hypothetical protein SAMN05421783_103322 [Thiocapsa roseopersicina]|uniref:Uncharacterized protein n=1 Tax=Thiocapsa roseopersicina TaxID=1058 RepID=A0A1H2T6Y9_THIRO|nr:hypothetical protein SAMN05421783_103322 [Thiocapsa roseopersicina]